MCECFTVSIDVQVTHPESLYAAALELLTAEGMNPETARQMLYDEEDGIHVDRCLVTVMHSGESPAGTRILDMRAST